jgi:hypothetical protein
MGKRLARSRVLARAFWRLRRCRFSRGAMEGVGVGRGWGDECRSKQSGWPLAFVRQRKKERVGCCLGEGRQKCTLAQGERSARYLRQGKANSQSRANFELIF